MNNKKQFLMRALLSGALVVAVLVLLFPPGKDVVVQVSSNPSGATVYIDGKQVGSTPLTVNARHGSQGHVRVSSSSYRSWEWRGIYPKRSNLTLDAQLIPQQ